LDRARDVCRRIEARFEGVLNQIDTYYRSPTGRLKLRQINNERAELIEYDRPNTPSTRTSTYRVTPVADVSKIVGDVLCVVRKRRELYLWHNVRIHLDNVEGLGTFIEFEGVVSPEADATLSRERVHRLVDAFGIAPADQIGVSYSDLLMRRQ
jgi:adenylate cyclase class IV